MIARSTITRLNAAALICLGVFFVLSVLGALVDVSGGWPEYVALGSAGVLAVTAAALRLKRRADLHRAVESGRESLLKHLRESRHKRE